MKKTKFLLILVTLFTLFLTLTACNKNTTVSDTTVSETTATLTNDESTTLTESEGTTTITDTETVTGEETTSLLADVTYDDLTVTYDGEKHKPEVSNLPEGATVKYTPGFGYKDVGTYSYKAVVTLGDESVTLKSTLTVEKAQPVITAETTQDFYLTDGIVKLNYSVDIDDATVVQSVSKFLTAGTYTVDLYTKSTSCYKESEHVTVTVNVHDSRLGISFPSATYLLTADSYTLNLSDITGVSELSSDYTASLSQSEFTEQGIYKVTLDIKNSSTDEVVESHRAIITIDYPDNADFKTYEDEMLVYFMEGDQSTLNIFFTDYKKYGFEHEDAIWYTYEPYTEEDYASDQAEVKRLREECDKFKTQKLSYNQINTYNVIEGNVKYYEGVLAEYKYDMMLMAYVDQYGGYISNFPDTMEAYTLRTKEDVEDLISYMDSTYTAFMSYMDYIKDKEKLGYGFSEFTLNGFTDYIDGILKYGEEYYLYGVLEEKIKNAKDTLSLTDDEVSAYVTRLKTAFTDKFLKGLTELDAAVKAYVTAAKEEGGYLTDFTEGYLSTYEGGKDLYTALLRNTLGIYDTNIDDLIKYLDSSVTKYLRLYSNASSSLTTKQENIADGKSSIISSSSPYAMIEFLKEFAKTIVPDLEATPDIDVTYMDETATENTTTVAYYMKSALDYNLKEYIHLNASALGTDKVDTMKTLAHEGYPGHLYSYVATKENENLSNIVRCMTNTGFGEGWAKYVEIALGEYLKEYKGTSDWAAAMDYLKYYDLFAFALYTRIDVGIGYESWTVSDVEAYLKKKGLNTGIAEDIYETLIEIPTQYDTYGYGQLLFYELHETAKEELGEYYNEVEYNTALLAHGWVDLDDLKAYMATYLENQKFLHGIA